MDNNVCEIHNKKMHKAFVRIHYGRTCGAKIRKEYRNARSRLCRGCVVKPEKWAIKYYCITCNKLRRKDKEYWRERYND